MRPRGAAKPRLRRTRIAPGSRSNSVVWAPWRIGYILEASKQSGCFLCSRLAEAADRDNLILHRAPLCFTVMNLYPYNNGHLMVAPNRHVARLSDLTTEESAELMRWAAKWEVALRARLQVDGLNLGLNLGRCAGAGLETHLHLHIVPRWNGDSNFMPVVAETKVISESLFATYDKLVGAV